MSRTNWKFGTWMLVGYLVLVLSQVKADDKPVMQFSTSANGNRTSSGTSSGFQKVNFPKTPVRATEFRVVVHRQSTTKEGLVKGTMSVNGQPIGACYENAALKIPPGTYQGKLRITSNHNFVQGPGGELGKTGDFLIEVARVPGRSNILIHAGNKPSHSQGCILCGPAVKNKQGVPFAPPTLKTLRQLFFDGNDHPTQMPNKVITIQVIDQ